MALLPLVTKAIVLDPQELYNYNILNATDRNTTLKGSIAANFYEAHWTARIPIGQR
jgi:hypothetical protein